MIRRFILGIVAVAAAGAVCGAPADADSPPKPFRTLVYDVTYGAIRTTREQTSGFMTGGNSVSSGNGEIDRTKAADDRGTLTVEVIAATQDGGLVVDVSFAGAKSAQERIRVAILSDGSLSYNPKTPLGVEAVRVLPFLARGLVANHDVSDGSKWTQSVMPPASGLTTYTVIHVDGTRAKIDVDATLREGSSYSEHVSGTTLYETDVLSPLTIDLTSRGHRDVSSSESDTTVTHVVATLLHDDFGKH